MSSLMNVDHLWGVCAGVGLLTMLGCTALGVLGALAYNIAASGSAGALRIGFRTPPASPAASGPPGRNESLS